MSNGGYNIDDVDHDVLAVIQNNEPLPTYEAAYAFLVSFEYHRIGQIVEVLYYKPKDAQKTDNDKIGAIVAIGTKNWYDTGVEAEEDDDRWDNGHYTPGDGSHGEEFFEVINCCCDVSGGGGFGARYTTTITINGKPFEVYNNNKRNETVGDPFEWEELHKDGDFAEMEKGDDPNGPLESDIKNTNITLNDSSFVVASKDEQTVTDPFGWEVDADQPKDDDIFGNFDDELAKKEQAEKEQQAAQTTFAGADLFKL